MGALKFLDTNILVYAFDASAGKKHEIARSLLNSCLEGETRFFISTQTISEFYWVTTRKMEKPLAKKEAERLCRMLIAFSGFIKLVPAQAAVLDAMRLDGEYGVPYWDALIAATMLGNGVTEVLTENGKDFKKIPHIRVINPFLASR